MRAHFTAAERYRKTRSVGDGERLERHEQFPSAQRPQHRYVTWERRREQLGTVRSGPLTGRRDSAHQPGMRYGSR